MVFQYARRCRWLLWLSGGLIVSSLASTKAASSFRRTLGATSEDQFNRQLSVNNSPVLDFNSIDEERGPLSFSPPSPDALVLYDEFVGSSMKYKAWMDKLGFQLEKGTDLDQKAFETVIPVLLKKHTKPQLRHLFHDPTSDFGDVTVQGESLGLRLLHYWKDNGVSDKGIMKRMLQPDRDHPNMLTDDSMLGTWISFSDGRELGYSFYYRMLRELNRSYVLKDVLRFYFVVSEKSGSPDLKKATLELTFDMFDKFYLDGWDRNKVVSKLSIIDGEVEEKMEAVLLRYDGFVASRSADALVFKEIVRLETKNIEQAVLLEDKLLNEWVKESWFPKYDIWKLGNEFGVFLRLCKRSKTMQV